MTTAAVEKPPTRATIPRDGDRILCLGSSGSGKTTLAVRGLIRDVRESGRHALVFDPTGDVYAYLTKGSALGSDVSARLPSQWIARVKTVDEARDALASSVGNWWRGRQCRVIVVSVGTLDYESALKLWVDLADGIAQTGWVLFADEAHLVFPLSMSLKSRVMVVMGLARNRRSRIYASTNYPQQLSTNLRQNSEHVCAFRANNRAFVDEGCRWFGNPEWFEDCLSLQKFEYIYRGRDVSEQDDEPVTEHHAIESAIPW